MYGQAGRVGGSNLQHSESPTGLNERESTSSAIAYPLSRCKIREMAAIRPQPSSAAPPLAFTSCQRTAAGEINRPEGICSLSPVLYRHMLPMTEQIRSVTVCG